MILVLAFFLGAVCGTILAISLDPPAWFTEG
jgi:hypothetical protein